MFYSTNKISCGSIFAKKLQGNLSFFSVKNANIFAYYTFEILTS